MGSIIVNEKQAKCLNNLGWSEDGEWKPWWDDMENIDEYTEECPNCKGWGYMHYNLEDCECCQGLGYLKPNKDN